MAQCRDGVAAAGDAAQLPRARRRRNRLCQRGRAGVERRGLERADRAVPHQRLRVASFASIAATVFGPTSRIIRSAGTASIGTVCVATPGVSAAATTASTGRTIAQPAAFAFARMSRAVACISASCSDLPTATPSAARNVLAIAPPITSDVDLGDEVAEQIELGGDLRAADDRHTGRTGVASAAASASSSACISRPA